MDRTENYMAGSTQRLDKVETAVVEVNTRMKMLETQMSQIAQAVGTIHQPGTFPSPKDCKAIHVESGNTYEGSPLSVEEPEKEEMIEKEKEGAERTREPEVHTAKPIVPKLPFPIRVNQAKKLDEKFSKFLDIFRRVHLNIPLIEALRQMPGYVKFLKEIMSKKKRLTDYETVNLAENCSAIIQQKVPKKQKDPGSFNISCVIGNDRQTKALCDLGASINLMPLSFFRKLKFGVLKPTTVTLHMVDRSVKHPNRILENMLVRVNDFIFPVDFIVLDMKEDPNVPLILGRPFLATGKALIDVTKGELTLRHGNKSAILSMFDKMKRYGVEEIKIVEDEPKEVMECKAIHVVQKVTVHKDYKPEPPLEEVTIPQWMFDEEGELLSCDEPSKKVIKKKKKKVAKVENGAPKGNDVEAPVKATWWKKRLTKLYFAALAKTEPGDLIRMRIEN